ncbi:acetyltransferase, GNAT family [Lachnospiraceae bacterium KM106-2]|nr:acetyltransferase, GNAT family [Lachnospiraceae bacterium KM106-2]
MLRAATKEDISRIAEILIFAKRTSYRCIFHDDEVSFNEMQVVSLANELSSSGALEDVVVCDDGIIRGMVRRGCVGEKEDLEIYEFYVDPFFQRNGYGSKMMEEVLKEALIKGYRNISLWVLEKNQNARIFYEKHGFRNSGDRKLEEGTTEFILRYEKQIG